MSTRNLLGLAAAAAFLVAGSASADRATTFLDQVEAEVQTKKDELDAIESPSKKEKKAKKAANRALKKLAKDTSTAADDLGTLKDIVGDLVKYFGDAQDLQTALAAAADSFAASVEGEVGGLRATIDPFPNNKKKKKADKDLNKADKFLSKADDQSKLAKRIGLICKAEKKTKKARKLASGGGNGGGCNDFGTEAGETATADIDLGAPGAAGTVIGPESFDANGIRARYIAPTPESPANRLSLIFEQCGNPYRQINFVFINEGAPAPGDFNLGLFNADASGIFFESFGLFGLSLNSGTLTVDSIDGNTIEGSFDFVTNGDPRVITNGSFRANLDNQPEQ